MRRAFFLVYSFFANSVRVESAPEFLRGFWECTALLLLFAVDQLVLLYRISLYVGLCFKLYALK